MSLKRKFIQTGPFLGLIWMAALGQATPVIKESSPGLMAKATYPGSKAIAQDDENRANIRRAKAAP